jgi:hypothetical protein
VAIDLETGDFEVDASEIAACDALKPLTLTLKSRLSVLVPVMCVAFGGRTKRAL